jgi:hypothetical protein
MEEQEGATAIKESALLETTEISQLTEIFQSPDPVRTPFRNLVRSWTPTSRSNSAAFNSPPIGLRPLSNSYTAKKKMEIDVSGKNLRKVEWKKYQLATILRLKSNQLTMLSDGIEALQELEMLDVSENMIAEISASLGTLPHLTHLYMAYNRLFLTPLPKTLGKLNRLKLLDMSSNELSVLPAEFSEMSALTHLDLSKNDFKEFPMCIIHISSLEVLKLNHNKLKELPDDLGAVEALKVRVIRLEIFYYRETKNANVCVEVRSST